MRVNRSGVEGRRSRIERGATLVEYALIVALLVGASLVAIRSLGSSASSEQAKQADCVGVRPAPAYCTDDFKVVSSTSTTTGGGNGAEVTTTTSSVVTTTTSTTTTTPPTTQAPTTTAAPTTTQPPTFDGSGSWYSYGRQNLQNSRWQATVTVSIKNGSGGNDKDAKVVIRYRTRTTEGTLECTTGGNGRCSVSLPLSDSFQYVDFTIETVDGLPLASPPGAQRVLQP